ncbi:MAG TPA: hypothetical protein VFE51_22815, partial [Verrucomicrobiae bacterium]|nr:hypothetical protein [Verrucomicrobiae bacterium]
MKHTVLTALLVCGFSASFAAQIKLDPALEGLSSQQTPSNVDVIVKFRTVPSNLHHRLVLSHGGQLKHSLDLIRSAHYSIPASELQSLAQEPDVEYVAPDRPVKGFATSYIGSPDFGWHTVGADLATSVAGYTGAGIGIALLDSGVINNPDLAGTTPANRIVYTTS